MAIFDQMTIEPAGISNVNVSLQNISFNIDVKLTNPTPENFTVDGYGLAELSEISIYYDGMYLATSQVGLTQVSIPSKNELILHNIPVNVPKPLDFISDHLVLVYSLISDFKKLDINKLTTTGKLSIAGQIIDI